MKDKMNILGREDILKARDITTQRVDVPEWGGTVIVRALTGKERDQYEDSLMKLRSSGRKGRGPKVLEPDLQGARARLVSLACIDEAGERLFTDADVAALAEKSAKALNRVFDVAAVMSGLSDDDLEELLGN